jgi:hypothetical protein
MSSDKEAFDGTVAYVNEYRAKGGSPDDYVLKSWADSPRKLLPASEPYTYTNLLTTVMKIVNTPPEGSLDVVANSQCIAGGWVYDADLPGKSITVSFFRDKDADSGGTLIGSYTTDLLRTDVNGARNLPVNSKHGYNITFTAASGLFDGKSHQLYAYGHDATDKTGIRKLFPLLSNSPQTITCSASGTPTPTPTSTPVSTLITASPSPCTIPTGSHVCAADITLNANGFANLQVKIREADNAPFTAVGASPTGIYKAPWIGASGYTFDLYSNGTVIGSVFVKGQP